VADELSARCDCGWSARGSEEEVVPKIQEHAREVHDLEITRDQALAQARPVQSG
jgi:predicted small metal-binding protein